MINVETKDPITGLLDASSDCFETRKRMQLLPLPGFGFVTELFSCRYVTNKNPPIASIPYSFTLVFIWLSCYRLGLPISKDSNLELPWWSGG